MASRTVKRKVHFSVIFAALAGVTFLLSWLDAFPRNWVEHSYARNIFPTISHIAGRIADAAPFSWLDLALVFAATIVVYSIRWRRPWVLLGVASLAYLWFFWSWGLNYHRVALEKTLGLEGRQVTKEQMDQFARDSAAELNRLWPVVSNTPFDRTKAVRFAGDRVQLVVSRIQETNWTAASRIKRSLLGEWWLRIAGIDGLFNPFGHEPVVASSLLGFEQPFIFAHELAHVRGIPNEGDANLIALFACIPSGDPQFQYSGWFHLWLYLRTNERDKLLDPGPRRDLQMLSDRIRQQEIGWAARLQSTVLDWHLKANSVAEGVASYGEFVTLAAASRARWNDFASEARSETAPAASFTNASRSLP